jgi:predicted transcriptional regulator
MLSHAELVAQALSNPLVKAEYDRIEREEMPMLDMLLKVRKEVGMTQAQIAKKMAPAVARLERALATGNMSPFIATLQKYAAALGKSLEIRMV